LEDYIGRMKEGQDKIYCLTAETFAAAKHSPHLEVFRKKGIEVLLLSDRVDEWMTSHLTEFDGKPLVSIAKGDLDLGALDDEADKEQIKAAEDEFKPIIEHMQQVLGDQVKEVRVSHRLTDSPACLVLESHEMAAHLQRILKQSGHDLPDSKPILEINPGHPILKLLKAEQDEDRFSDLTYILFDQSMLAEGGQLKDPATFVGRLNDVIMKLSGATATAE